MYSRFFALQYLLHMPYNRRRGIEWETALYHNCLNFLDNNKIMVQENTYCNIALEQLHSLTIAIFPNHGHRKKYRDQVRYFLEIYYQTISSDLANIKDGLESIYAPKLRAWHEYKTKLCRAMCFDSIRQHTEQFLSDVNYQLPSNVRSIILNEMHSCEEEEMNKKFNEKKLNNCLWFNRVELCEEIKFNKAISTDSNDDISSNDYLLEFTKCEIDLSVTNYCKFSAFYDNLTSAPKIDCHRTPLESISLDNTSSQSAGLKKRQRKTRKSYTRAANFHQKVSGGALEFFERKDTDDKVQLMKKLIIKNCIASWGNDASTQFMEGTGRINRQTKKFILETVYDAENVKQSHYALLDLLFAERYLIRQKVKEVLTFFKNNDVNFHKECEGMSCFADIELKFYEVISISKSIEQNE